MKPNTDKNASTVNAYNNDPVGYSEKFDRMGIRQKDIDLAISLIKSGGKSCLEIGCGSGRDAKYIIQRTDKYIGNDASEGLLKLAKIANPDADFRLGDIRNVGFESNSFDIIFAFASLLHLNEGEIKEVLNKIFEWLISGGILFVSLKYGLNRELEKKDLNGSRFFYFYTPEEIRELANKANFEVVYENRQQILGVDWFEMAFQKK